MKEPKKEEPEEKEETKEKCEAASDVKYSSCLLDGARVASSTLRYVCAGQGSREAGVNVPYVNAGVSKDDYQQCKDLVDSDLLVDDRECTKKNDEHKLKYCK